jgi:hypothetical protein
MMDQAKRIDGAKLKEVVGKNIETLCRDCYPQGHKNGAEWKIADVSGAKGDSLGNLPRTRHGWFMDRPRHGR